MTNQSRWSLSHFSIRRDVVSVLSSNHFSSQQLANYPTNRLLPFPIMPMMNSRTFQSSSGLNTITRPSPRRSGGDYPSGQQVCQNKSGLLLMKTDLCQEIGLVAFMFFFELLFFMFLRLFPSMFPLLTYSQSFIPLIC